MRTLFLILLVTTTGFSVHAQGTLVPWDPAGRCKGTGKPTAGLLPQARDALQAIRLDHLTTNTLNTSKAKDNYHDVDVTVGGQNYTAAVDLRSTCMTEAEIKQLLATLAASGFAAWYRKNGADDWDSNSHIHAVWAAEPLKPQLRSQVTSWLAGRTGLKGNNRYGFWQPSEEMRRHISQKYEASKKAGSP